MDILKYVFWEREKETIFFPKKLNCDESGYNFCAEFLQKTSKKKKFKLDFLQIEKFEENLCAVIGAIIEYSGKRGASFEFVNANHQKVKNTLIRNGFISGEISTSDKINRALIPYKMFDMTKEAEVEEYIYRHVLLSEQIPKMSEGARRKIFRSIFEVYQNSVLHSKASKIHVCGQLSRYENKLALTMVEIGRTFHQNVTGYKSEYKNFTGVQCLEWAVKSGNTTKPDNEAGGLGLDLIRDFLKLNKGKIQIISSNGLWEEKKGTTFATGINNVFGGSIVNIEFNLADKNSYSIPEEINIQDIL